MRRPVSKILDYLVLSFFVSGAIVGTLIFNGNRNFQMINIATLSILYVLWGIYHHYRENTLHPKIILEYIAFALLGTALVIGLF